MADATTAALDAAGRSDRAEEELGPDWLAAVDGMSPTVSYPLFVSDPWLFERAIWIDLATPVTGLGRKKRIYSRLVICLGARVW